MTEVHIDDHEPSTIGQGIHLSTYPPKIDDNTGLITLDIYTYISKLQALSIVFIMYPQLMY